MTVLLVDSALPVHPAVIGEVRHHVERVLAATKLTGLRDEASLVVSELLTNAVRHARLDIRLSVGYTDPVLRIEVFDDNADEPELQEIGQTRESGRGLALVAAAASRWGTTPAAGGKIVWAEIRATVTPPR